MPDLTKTESSASRTKAVLLIENIPLKRGEYDIVNISVIGHDPITGRDANECIAEHQAAVSRVADEGLALRWWDLVGRFRVARKLRILQTRMSCAGPFRF